MCVFRKRGLSVFGYPLQFFLVDKLYLPAVDGNDLVGSKGGKSTDGIARGHVRHVGKLLSAEIDAQRVSVFFKAIAVFQCDKGFGKTSADMLLSEAYGAAVGFAELYGKLLYQFAAYLDVGVKKLVDDGHRHGGNNGMAKREGGREIVVIGEIRPEAENLGRNDGAQNLVAPRNTALAYLYLSADEPFDALGNFQFLVDVFVFLEFFNREVF